MSDSGELIFTTARSPLYAWDLNNVQRLFHETAVIMDDVLGHDVDGRNDGPRLSGLLPGQEASVHSLDHVEVTQEEGSSANVVWSLAGSHVEIMEAWP